MAKTIITHGGRFHADEVVAYGILNTIFPDNVLIRTRNNDIIKTGDIVIDVGLEYSPRNNRFDHHQKECNKTFGDSLIPMSSCGMIYLHFGKDFLLKRYSIDFDDEKCKYTGAFHNINYGIYEKFIKEIDAIDNGISDCVTYHNLSSLISKMNSDDVNDNEKQMINFKKASELAMAILDVYIAHHIKTQITFNEDYKIMYKCMRKRWMYDESGQTVVIDEDCNNWYQCLMSYEGRETIHESPENVKFIIYKNKNSWRIRTVQKNFISRTSLKTYDELKKKLGDKLTFVHKKLFLAETIDLDSAIEIAKISGKPSYKYITIGIVMIMALAFIWKSS